MKFVIKDHLEMIPDILSVIEKMTKDEGNFLLNIFHFGFKLLKKKKFQTS